jgi:hypothetical protein
VLHPDVDHPILIAYYGISLEVAIASERNLRHEFHRSRISVLASLENGMFTKALVLILLF